MPRIAGLSLTGVAVASVAFYLVGFLWYGLIFNEAWMAAEGVTAADAENQSPIWMLGGFLITVMQVIGVGLVLKWRGVKSIGAAAATAVLTWLLFALPFVHYAYVYLPAHNATLLMIDGSHLLVGWLVAAIILAVMK